MHDIPDRIANVLLKVEIALRPRVRWNETSPTTNELASALPFCMGALSFEQWLQWVFLPRINNTLDQTRYLADNSGILACADEYLLSPINRFDDPIALQSMAKRH